MRDEQLVTVAVELDRLILESRLQDFALLAQTDRRDRISAIVAVISKLDKGAFLIGCGPYSCGVLPLSVDEVVLGRPPSPLEELPETVADFTLNDAVWLVPRETSRIHASIVCRKIDAKKKYFLRDKGSRFGTYVNRKRLSVIMDSPDSTSEVELSCGDVVSLGPSGVNSYLFYNCCPTE